jgi:hypothetical protein
VIFKPEMVEKILAGKKSVTRRPVKWEDTGFEVRNLPCRYEVGKTYAVQPGRGQKAVARIRIKDVRRGLISGVDDAEARLEGFTSSGMFPVYWEQLYGSYDATRLVDRIEFELVEGAA